MPGIKKEDLDNMFSYHMPVDAQPIQYDAIRTAAKVFATAVLENTPGCPDQTVAIRHIRDAVMTANASIALGGRF